MSTAPPSLAPTLCRPRTAFGAGTLIWSLVAVGVALRIARYAANRSLWLDESMLALNIVDRPLADLLFTPLTHHQGAPPLFLLFEKLAVTALGPGEPALRLFPLIAGVAAVVVFAFVARRILSPLIAPLAVALLAFDEMAIYYAAETKQYAADLLAACALALLALRAADRPHSARRLVALAAAGVVAPWLSHPSVFVLAGGGLTLFLAAVARNNRRQIAALLAVGGLWLASFLGVYVVNLRPLAGDPYLLAYWVDAEAFVPLVPASAADLYAWPRALLRIGRDLFAAPSSSTAPARLAGTAVIALAGLGALRLFARGKAASPNRPAPNHPAPDSPASAPPAAADSTSTRSRLDGLAAPAIIVLPLVLTFAASALGTYPLFERLALFLHPALILLAAAGVAALLPSPPAPRSTPAPSSPGASPARAGAPYFALALAAALLAYPLFLQTKNLAAPPGRDELRPVLRAIAADPATAASPPVLFTLAGARAGVTFYLAHDPRCAALASLVLLHGPAEVWRSDQKDLNEADVLAAQAPGAKRVWVILSTTWHPLYAAQAARVRDRFAARGGRIVSEHARPGAVATLYQLP